MVSIHYSKSIPRGSKWSPKSSLEASWETGLRLKRGPGTRLYIYIYIYIESRACFARARDSLEKLIVIFFIGGEIAMRKPTVVSRRGGISSMEYHLFLDINRCRSITSEKKTQTPKAARNDQMRQKNKRTRATSDHQ